MSLIGEAKRMHERAFQVREEFAAKLFDRREVGMLIKGAVERGETQVRVRQERPLDLSLTDAALATHCWLQKQGYHVRWLAVAWPEIVKGRPTGLQISYPEMMIDWSGHGGNGGFLQMAQEFGLTAQVRSGEQENSTAPLAEGGTAPNT